MDTLSVAGILIALAAIIGGNLLEGGHTDSLVQLTAFVIVVGGTLGAIMVQVPLPTFLRSLQLGRWVFKPPRFEPSATIRKIVQWSNIARKGLQLVVDGNEPETIRSIMEVDLDSHEYRDMQAARVFEGMGGYAPTVGIIGAVLGLIHVMNNLADPELLGEGIAVAFVATIYGVGLANLFLLPAASKLKGYIHRQAQFREMVIEGLVSIAEGENPRNIETKLQGYLLMG